MNYPYLSGYASQFLSERGIEIYSGSVDKGNRLFNKIHKKLYDVEAFETHLTISAELQEKQVEIREDVSYEELRKAGLMIVRVETRQRLTGCTLKNKRYIYKIVQAHANIPDYGGVPDKHDVHYNVTHGTYRIFGTHVDEFALSQWVKPKNFVKEKKTSNVLSDRLWKAQRLSVERNPFVAHVSDLDIPIEEIPVLRTADGATVCIEERVDEPRMVISGSSGSGKTSLLNALVSRARLKDKRCILLNDVQNEVGAWTLPVRVGSKEFYELKDIGEKPTPLPAFFLHCAGDADEKVTSGECGVGYKFSLPFDKMIADWNHLVKGKSDWEFRNSATWVRNMFKKADGSFDEKIFECKSLQDFFDFVDEKAVEFKELSGIKEKVKAVFTDIWNQGFLDVSSGLSSKWVVKKPNEEQTFYPWMAGLYAGLVPVVETENLQNKDWFPVLFRFIVEDIVRNQKKGWFKDNEIFVWCFIDEIHTLLEKSSVAEDMIDELNARGRFNRIGVVSASQYYESIPKSARMNADYCFAFIQNDDHAKAIARDYALERRWVPVMKRLEPFECIAIPRRGCFVRYEADGTRVETREVQRGFLIHSLNQHAAPSAKKLKRLKKKVVVDEKV